VYVLADAGAIIVPAMERDSLMEIFWIILAVVVAFMLVRYLRARTS
jgi:hypothetical protein